LEGLEESKNKKVFEKGGDTKPRGKEPQTRDQEQQTKRCRWSINRTKIKEKKRKQQENVLTKTGDPQRGNAEKSFGGNSKGGGREKKN